MSDGNTAPANPGDTIRVWGNTPNWGEPGSGAGLGLNPDFDPATGNGWLPDEDGYTEALPVGVQADVQAAINQVAQVSGSLMCADIWKLKPATGYPWDPKNVWEPVFVYFPAQAVTGADLSSWPASAPVHTRIQDDVHDGRSISVPPVPARSRITCR